jgi:hypothetical protein
MLRPVTAHTHSLEGLLNGTVLVCRQDVALEEVIWGPQLQHVCDSMTCLQPIQRCVAELMASMRVIQWYAFSPFSGVWQSSWSAYV